MTMLLNFLSLSPQRTTLSPVLDGGASPRRSPGARSSRSPHMKALPESAPMTPVEKRNMDVRDLSEYIRIHAPESTSPLMATLVLDKQITAHTLISLSDDVIESMSEGDRQVAEDLVDLSHQLRGHPNHKKLRRLRDIVTDLSNADVPISPSPHDTEFDEFDWSDSEDHRPAPLISVLLAGGLSASAEESSQLGLALQTNDTSHPQSHMGDISVLGELAGLSVTSSRSTARGEHPATPRGEASAHRANAEDDSTLNLAFTPSSLSPFVATNRLLDVGRTMSDAPPTTPSVTILSYDQTEEEGGSDQESEVDVDEHEGHNLDTQTTSSRSILINDDATTNQQQASERIVPEEIGPTIALHPSQSQLEDDADGDDDRDDSADEENDGNNDTKEEELTRGVGEPRADDDADEDKEVDSDLDHLTSDEEGELLDDEHPVDLHDERTGNNNTLTSQNGAEPQLINFDDEASPAQRTIGEGLQDFFRALDGIIFSSPPLDSVDSDDDDIEFINMPQELALSSAPLHGGDAEDIAPPSGPLHSNGH